MKTRHFLAAAMAVLTLAAAGAAAAQGYGRGHDRQRAEITIRDDGRQFSVDRNDRLFYRLIDRPYHFRPGLTYAYTDRCNRNGCSVLVFSERSRRPVDRIFAPRLPNRGDWRDDDRRDGRWDDRRDGRDDDRRDGDRRNGRRDGSGLEGGPR